GRRVQAPHHRRPEQGLHRLRGRAHGAGGRRGGRPHGLRPRAPPDRARRGPAAPARGRPRARRERAGRPRRRDRRPAAALGAAGRRAARRGVRPRGRPGWQVHDHAGGERAHRLPDERVLAQGGRRGVPAAHGGARRQHRRPGLRRHRRLARVRLDGRLQGRPGVRLPVPGPRPRPARRAGEPHLRGPARDARRVRHPRLRRARGLLAPPGPARLGRQGPQARGRRGPLPALGHGLGHHGRDRPRRRRLPRDGSARPCL
ncbi:MAG: Enoyl-[acyl-carrier-protein] reductase [NADH], partial [uncultured Solirubrobacteraceae bacterium]